MLTLRFADYFFNVTRYPKKHERIELAARVNCVPGCESGAYTPQNVEFYFANMRKRHPQASTVVVKRELVEEPLSFPLGAGGRLCWPEIHHGLQRAHA